MIKKYSYYSKNDPNKEPIFCYNTFNRLKAAQYFAQLKHLNLKTFLQLYSVTK